ncbi:hypothetical protein CTI14_20715 [Methylobacterium radiotolerans]|nr:hypothetical protein CTI14_20715 [Methylobacterium radiotolerans]
MALAYERAVFDMQADYILSTYGRLTTQTILTRFEDQSSNKDVFDPVELEAALKAGGGRLEALIDKALTLLDKKLDNALVEEGVPAEDVKKMTVEQKKTLFKDNLSKSVTKSAYQNMQGLVPVQTRIFSQTANGKKAMLVAVIAVQSEKDPAICAGHRAQAADAGQGRPQGAQGFAARQ